MEALSVLSVTFFLATQNSGMLAISPKHFFKFTSALLVVRCRLQCVTHLCATKHALCRGASTVERRALAGGYLHCTSEHIFHPHRAQIAWGLRWKTIFCSTKLSCMWAFINQRLKFRRGSPSSAEGGCDRRIWHLHNVERCLSRCRSGLTRIGLKIPRSK